ncbi:MAG TPA: hypothetical protein DIT25_00475 [Candidatus Moranbacteria bacterium]|nr:hypothetical protein [Candidatus Moranbacteria bacterium]
MQQIVKHWNNFKSRPDIWFFYAFLITFPLSIRKVLFFYPIQGNFNEYTSIYLYLSDIFLFLTISSWLLFLLYNKLYLLSNKTAPVPRTIHNIFSFRKIVSRGTIVSYGTLLGIAFLVISSLNGATLKNLEVFKIVKLLELIFLYFYITHVPRGTFFRNLAKITVFLGVAHSLIAILQFSIQKSLGLSWLWESALSQDLPGVAKLALNGDKWIRAYGLFPHPNVLGGFLLFSIILTWAYPKLFHATAKKSNFLFCSTGEKLFHVEQPGSKMFHNISVKCSTWNNPACVKQFLKNLWNKFQKRKSLFSNLFHVEHFSQCTTLGQLSSKKHLFAPWNKTRCIYINLVKQIRSTLNVPRGTFRISKTSRFLIPQYIALFLTFSKSAMLGLLIAMIYIVSRGTFKSAKQMDVSQPEQFIESVPQAISNKVVFFFKKFSIKAGLFHVEQLIKNSWNNSAKKVPESKADPDVEQLSLVTPFSRGTINRRVLLVFAIIVALIINLKPDFDSLFLSSLRERLIYLNVSRGTIMDNPILGVGMGQFVPSMQSYSQVILLPWQYQPVHNVFLLIWSELGIIGLFVFLWFLWKLFHLSEMRQKNVPRETPDINNAFIKGNPDTISSQAGVKQSEVTRVFQGILLGLLFIMMFDHYLWDIQQGQILLWLVAGLLARVANGSIDK